MNSLSFSEEEKIKAFDRLADCFLQCNFGSVGKSDIELLFFSIVMEHLKKHQLSMDDYSVSNILGITQQRVRNLKVKNQLRNQYAYDWKADLAVCAKYARYSEDDENVIINLNDPVLSIEVQHFIERNGGFFDYSLNPKLLKMPTRDFAMLLVEIGISENEKNVLSALREKYQQEVGKNEQITREKLMIRIKKGAVSFGKDVITSLIVSGITQGCFKG